ncbi:shikimate kinase [Cohnella sp. JJ-181]|uniref:shikimate kinase n=1 Tax=Cohnella rhizoplanae TaxID=2974897 RepID=UPI0022FFA674|nr:shikimate kinase [Cohnella sp. JJ-181]CAI6087382.1 Shikimate kinase [Cohnella sp. JJ-181]
MLADAANPVRDRNIVLIGFMGAGKTTAGKLLAAKLSSEFIDVDDLIASERGMPVTEIFRTIGEAAFRRMEKEYIEELCAGKRSAVLSLGGGAFLQEAIRDVCLSTSDVILLDISWDMWKSRLPLIRDSRPILQNKTDEEIKALYDSRQAIYAGHHFKVNAGELTPEAAAQEMFDWLASRARG